MITNPVDINYKECYNLTEISEDRQGVGDPIFWGESHQGEKGDLGVLTRQLTSQEYSKRIVGRLSLASRYAFCFPNFS